VASLSPTAYPTSHRVPATRIRHSTYILNVNKIINAYLILGVASYVVDQVADDPSRVVSVVVLF
jgi:hypothetical protein